MTLLSKLVPQLEQTYTWYGEVVHPYLDPGLQICKRTCVNHPVIVLSSSIVGLSIVYYYASRPRNLPPGEIIKTPCIVFFVSPIKYILRVHSVYSKIDLK